MSLIIGLDVSTSTIGLCIVDSTIVLDDAGSHILLLDRIELKKCETLWEKADVVEQRLGGLTQTIDRVAIEEPLMGFRPGMSSAQTISTLMKFNGIVSYIARNVFKRDPEYISAAHARKLCGVKRQKTSVAGPQKEQVFRHMSQNDLKHVVWPTKKNGKLVDWSRDATDSYCIARAAMIE